MEKQKLRYGYEFITCPISKSKTFDYCSYSEFGWEQQSNMDTVKQAYSPVMEGFLDIKKDFKNPLGEYISKNAKKHKRVRRKLNIKNIEVNPEWVFYT